MGDEVSRLQADDFGVVGYGPIIFAQAAVRQPAIVEGLHIGILRLDRFSEALNCSAVVALFVVGNTLVEEGERLFCFPRPGTEVHVLFTAIVGPLEKRVAAAVFVLDRARIGLQVQRGPATGAFDAGHKTNLGRWRRVLIGERVSEPMVVPAAGLQNPLRTPLRTVPPAHSIPDRQIGRAIFDVKDRVPVLSKSRGCGDQPGCQCHPETHPRAHTRSHVNPPSHRPQPFPARPCCAGT